MGKKKPFIDRSSARHFHLVNTRHQDSLGAEDAHDGDSDVRRAARPSNALGVLPTHIPSAPAHGPGVRRATSWRRIWPS
jgi:hypothetical protein